MTHHRGTSGEENENRIINLNPQKKIRKRSGIGTAIKFIGEIVFDAVIIIALVLFIRTYLIAPFQVHGTSMCNTLNYRNGICNSGYGEYLIISKPEYIVGNPKRGDIIVFRPPGREEYNKLEALFRTLLHIDGQDYFIKRVIGLPGETVELKSGYVYVDGTKLNETYLSQANLGKTNPLVPGKTVFRVPEGSYMALGDNRQVSTDSRSCFRSSALTGCRTEQDAFIKPESIEGKARVILFPVEKIGTIKNHDYLELKLELRAK